MKVIDAMTDELEQPVGPVMDASGQPVKRSYSRRGNGAKTVVKLDEHDVYVGAVTNAEISALSAVEREFQRATKVIERELAQRILKPEEAEARTMEATIARQKAHEDALVGWVIGWSLPDDEGGRLPCNEETIRDLPFPDIFALSLSIQQKFALGIDASRFLGAA